MTVAPHPTPTPQGKVPLSLDGAVVMLGGETPLPKVHPSLTGLWVKEVAVGEDMAVVVDKDGRLWQISLKEQGQPEVGGAVRRSGVGQSEGGGGAVNEDSWLCWFPGCSD